MISRVRSLLGVPYLWGGRTPAGFDCSGFVQQVLGERGVLLPRDAWEQRAACRPLPRRESPLPGDLLFFGIPRARVSHVGLALGGGYFADCRGRVRIASMESDNPLVDSALMAQYRGAGRPPGGGG
jgi:cell wall-associated NlpC family hydrolase